MKKIFLFLGFIFSFIICLAQPTVPRSSASNTPIDIHLFTTRTLRPPVAYDTTVLNSFISLDSCGKIGYTYKDNSLWLRKCNPKRWEQVGSGQQGSGVNIYNSDGILTGHRVLTGNNNTYSITLDSLSGFTVKANVGVQYSRFDLSTFVAGISYIGNPNTSSVSVANGNVSMGIVTGNGIYISSDSIRKTGPGVGLSNDTTNRKVQTINPITGAESYSNWIGTGSSTSSDNANLGLGYRWLVPNSQGIKTSFPGLYTLIDSTSNTNGLTFKVDSAIMFPQIRSTITAVTPGGNLHNVQIKRVSGFYGSDSLIYTGLGLVNLGDYTGRSLKLSDATSSIHNLYIGGIKYLSNYGPTLDNLWLGKNSGSTSAIATNSQNIAIGINTLQNVQSQGNIAIGTEAMKDFTAAIDPTGDSKNIAIGNSAMSNATGGQNNIGIGNDALKRATNGSFSNTVVGKATYAFCTDCNANSIYGASIGNKHGTWNAQIGADQTLNDTSGSFNSLVGAWSMTNNITGSNNAAVGYTSLGGNTTGNHNVGFGDHAGSTNQTGSFNIFDGDFAGAYNPSDSYQYIVHSENKGGIGKALIGGDLQLYRAAINVREDSVRLLPYTFQVNGNMSLHHTNFTVDTNNHKPIVWNTTTGLFERSYWAAGGGATTPAGNNNNLQINRHGAFYSPLLDTLTYRTDSGLVVRNEAYINGIRVGRGLAGAITNTVFGVLSGNAFTSGTNNTFMGYHSGLAANSGGSNSGFGQNVLASLTTGSTNTGMGNGVLGILQGGSSNVAIGASSMVSAVSTSNTTAVGTLALQVVTGNNNTAQGYQAGLNVTTGTGNAIFGYNTGIGITTGTGNTILGASITGLASGLTNNIQIASGGGVKALHDGTNWTLTGSTTLTNGNLTLGTAGNKINITTGTNASVGVSGAMTAGTITISTTAVTASSKIFLTHATVGGTQGILSVGTITAATSFVINSSSALDVSTINYWIIN